MIRVMPLGREIVRETVCVLALCGAVLSCSASFAENTGATGQGDSAQREADEAALLSRALADSGQFPSTAREVRASVPVTQPPSLRVTGNDGSDGSKTVHVEEALGDTSVGQVGVDAVTAAPPIEYYEPDRSLQSGGPGSAVPYASVQLGGVGALRGSWDSNTDLAGLSFTVDHSLPITQQLSVGVNNSATVQDSFSSLTDSSVSGVPTAGSIGSWQNASSVRMALATTGTTVSVSRSTSSTDPTAHHTLGIDQKVLGPLQVSAGVTDPGEASASESLTARFKVNW